MKGIRLQRIDRRVAILIVVSLVLVAVARWQALSATRARGVLAPNTEKYANLEYARLNGKPLRLDLYVPTKPREQYPVIVWIHGGSWMKRSKDEPNPAFILAPDHYAIAAIDFRQSQQAVFPAQVYDCKAAIRWLRAHAAEYRLDADHIGVWGDSSGGHLAALLGTSGGVPGLEGDEGNAEFSSRVQCVVDWYGPTDLMEAVNAPVNRRNLSAKAAVHHLLGGNDARKAALASPLTFVSKDDPPFLIMHGEADQLIPVEQSRRLDAALRAAGVPSQLITLPGEGHNPPGVYKPDKIQIVQQFLDQYLQPQL